MANVALAVLLSLFLITVWECLKVWLQGKHLINEVEALLRDVSS